MAELVVLPEGLAVVGGEDQDGVVAEGALADEADQLPDALVLAVDRVAVVVVIGLVVVGALALQRGLEGASAGSTR